MRSERIDRSRRRCVDSADGHVPFERRDGVAVTAVQVVLADTVTALDARHRGQVLVTGSHGGLIAAALAAQGGVRAAIFNDAGGGLDDAGFAGLAWLERLGWAAATVAHTSARIADARDALDSGVISHANALAASCGVRPGMPCAAAAAALVFASPARGAPPPHAEARVLLRAADDAVPAIRGLDSIGMVRPDDAGCLLVIGSHGGLHGGRPESALPVAAAGAVFHDAGRGKDGASVSRLPVLAARGMPAATVDYRSARIGDARSLWATGRLSVVNAVAAVRGWRVGDAVPDALTRRTGRGAPPSRPSSGGGSA